MNSMTQLSPVSANGFPVAGTRDFVTATIAGQLFGLPVLQVQDVLGPQRISPVPLAPLDVVGSLNLRGRIVTAIDLRQPLGLSGKADPAAAMGIVVEHGNELYALLVDTVGEVLTLSAAPEATPGTVPPGFRAFARGVHTRSDALLIEFDFDRLMTGLASEVRGRRTAA